MSPEDKPLVWLHGEVKTPPFGKAARIEAGVLLRQLQQGTVLSLPHSRPMPQVGGSPQTPKAILKAARRRLREYDDA